MPEYLEGDYDASDVSFGLAVSRFNTTITERLLDGALDTLQRHGVDMDRVTVAWCPGAFELPLVAKRMAESGSYDAVICLGVVIRGDTPHFELVAGEVASGTTRASLDTGMPVTFGVLTTDTLEQAIERAGTKAGNKGTEAALAALEMVNLLRAL